MDELQLPDSIWTWSSSGRKSKASLWIPYLQSVTKVKGAKGHWKVTFNGGEFQFDLDKVEVILFYGASGDLPLTFLDELAPREFRLYFIDVTFPTPMFLCQQQEEMIQTYCLPKYLSDKTQRKRVLSPKHWSGSDSKPLSFPFRVRSIRV